MATALDDQGILDESSVDPAVAPHLEAWRKFRRESGFSPKAIEQIVQHPTYRYCGTIDRDGIDIKTGGPCKWHIIQAAAYQRASNALTWRSVYLMPTGLYTTHVYHPIELMQAWGVFQAALVTYNWKKENKVA
jgi:hypothetical protein